MNVLKNSLKALIAIFQRRPRGIVRSMFSLVTLALFLATIIGQEASYVRLESRQSTVEKGDQFSIDVYVRAHVPVNAVDATLKFDSQSAEVIGVNRGESILSVWAEDPIIANSSVTLRGGTFRRGFVGEHMIATIDLRAKKAGHSVFSLENVVMLAGDGSGKPITAATTNDSSVTLFIYDKNTTLEDVGVNVKASLASDINEDGKVNLRDISAFVSGWTNKNQLYDFNGDGRMSLPDFSMILADYFLGE